MKEDSVFDPGLLTPRVKQLDGQRVRIRGFIYPSVFQQTGITRFPLVKNTECKFGPGGVAHHIIVVEMQPEAEHLIYRPAHRGRGRLYGPPLDGPGRHDLDDLPHGGREGGLASHGGDYGGDLGGPPCRRYNGRSHC